MGNVLTVDKEPYARAEFRLRIKCGSINVPTGIQGFGPSLAPLFDGSIAFLKVLGLMLREVKCIVRRSVMFKLCERIISPCHKTKNIIYV